MGFWAIVLLAKLNRMLPKFRDVRTAAQMFVPADGMNGESPERKGAKSLVRLFTFVSVRIVQVQNCADNSSVTQTV